MSHSPSLQPHARREGLDSQFWCFLFLIILFIDLFLAVLGVRCCAGFSLAVASRDYYVAEVLRLFIAVASPISDRRFWSTAASVVAAPRL